MAKPVEKKRIVVLLLVSFLLTLLLFGPIKRAILGDNSKDVEVIPTQVFYANHVAPILNDHCVTCHRANGTAPFALTSYEYAFRKKTTIRKVVEKGIMPPWPADPTYSHFLGENFLSDDEKQILYKWVDQGARFGDSAKLPEVPTFNMLSNLGKPDVTVYMDSVLIEGNNRDKFYVVKSPF